MMALLGLTGVPNPEGETHQKHSIRQVFLEVNRNDAGPVGSPSESSCSETQEVTSP